jgi:hypothetical protein
MMSYLALPRGRWYGDTVVVGWKRRDALVDAVAAAGESMRAACSS